MELILVKMFLLFVSFVPSYVAGFLVCSAVHCAARIHKACR